MKKSVVASLALLTALPTAALAENVTTYHNALNRHGLYHVPGLTSSAAATMHLDPAFNATVSGNVYAQPLYWKPAGSTSGRVIVATENNLVYALDAATGAVIWQTQLAPNAPLSAFPCGNINPEGITGTPVIDAGSGTLYLNALTKTGNASPLHLLYALSLNTGAVVSGWPIDMQAGLAAVGVTLSPLTQGERSALLYFNSNLYVMYGGKSGDCGTYHGTVAQVNPATPAVTAGWATRANRGGIWAQGGAAGDGKAIYVTTGNTAGATTWGDGEAIIRLKPGLAEPTSTKDYFAPTNWMSLDNSDADLGGTEALPIEVPVAGGKSQARSIAFGKDGNAYLVNLANLGGISAPAALLSVSNSEIITAPAVLETATAAMVAFTNRAPKSGCSGTAITMLNVTGGATPLNVAWCAPFSGGGSPIITTTDAGANPLVWVVGASGDNLLHGFDAMTGAVVFGGGGAGMQGLRGFQTLIAAQGHFYVAADNKVYGFTFTGAK